MTLLGGQIRGHRFDPLVNDITGQFGIRGDSWAAPWVDNFDYVAFPGMMMITILPLLL